MKSLRASAIAVAILALALANPVVKAKDKDKDKDKDKIPSHITVAFGTGLNNAQPGNTPNHHILPPEFSVRITRGFKLDGVTPVVIPATVNFIISGFHWPWVYQPGTEPGDITVPAAGAFVNFDVNVFAKGVNPGTPPAFADITPANPVLSAAQNRTDSFAFSTPGKYLVICNVRGHFVDGMFAWINVVADDDDKDKDK